jgi:hypothetical protein
MVPLLLILTLGLRRRIQIASVSWVTIRECGLANFNIKERHAFWWHPAARRAYGRWALRRDMSNDA